MTTKPTERDLLGEVEELLAKATPGPWAVWDSCSWRRIGTRDPFADGNVICPVTQRDGHPDLQAKREDLELAAAAPELLRRLVAEVKRLRGDHAAVRESVDRLVNSDFVCSRCGSPKK